MRKVILYDGTHTHDFIGISDFFSSKLMEGPDAAGLRVITKEEVESNSEIRHYPFAIENFRKFYDYFEGKLKKGDIGKIAYILNSHKTIYLLLVEW